MKTIEIKVYEWKELREKAKDYARYEYFGDYNWAHDAMASLKGFAAHFNAKLNDWRVDWANGSPSSTKFDLPDIDLIDEEHGEAGAWLAERIGSLKTEGYCQFTGYCMDDDANEGAVAVYKAGERDLEKILQAGFRSWLKSAQADYEHQISDEGIAETCEANDYQFYDNGEMV